MGEQNKKCKFPDGIVIKPDGINELDPCVYREVEVIHNVTAHVLVCQKCGHVELEFERQSEWIDEPDWTYDGWDGERLTRQDTNGDDG